MTLLVQQLSAFRESKREQRTRNLFCDLVSLLRTRLAPYGWTPATNTKNHIRGEYLEI